MGDRPVSRHVVMFAVVAALASATQSAARAQDALKPSIGTFPKVADQPTRRPVAPLPLDEPDKVAQSSGPPIADDDDGQFDTPDGVERASRIGQRTPPTDGDVNDPLPEVELQDGIVDVGEPEPPEDGVEAGTLDTRSPEDIAIFESPPAGFDPLLFQIEDIDPVRDDRRVDRLARLEPYDPVGVRIGSFVLFPELEIGGLSNSNVFRSPDRRSDIAAEFRPSARLVSNWSRHALEFSGTGAFSFYQDFDTENDETYALEARGRLDVTRRTNVQAIASHERSLESRSAINASDVGSRTPVEIDRAEAAFNQRFNRLSVQIRGSVGDYTYGDTENLGLVTSNSDRDYVETTHTARATWEFKPTLSAFTEVSINQRDYDQPAQSDFINRTSDGQRYRVGLGFGDESRILRGEISLGYGVQSPDDARLRDIDGLIIDANATWRVTELTSLLFNASSDVTETNIAGVSGALSRSVGVEVRHAFRRHVIASAGLAYLTQDSQDGRIDDKELRSTVGLEYFVSPETVLYGAYAHTNFEGVGTDSDYTVDEVRLGVRLRR